MRGWHFDEPVYSGQSGAFRQLGPTKIAVFTVMNAMGSIVDRDGRVVRCAQRAGECGTIASRFAERVRLETPPAEAGPGNTTITLVVTKPKLPLWALQRLAAQAAAGS
jgi:L-aminopeptidase/D-esterase-like protein